MRRLLHVALAGLAATLSGCVYTHTVRPLTTNFHDTPVVTESSAGDVKQIDYNYVRVSWSANALGEIAKKTGFEEIYYADLETLQILGVWTQQWAHVYGRKAAATGE